MDIRQVITIAVFVHFKVIDAWGLSEDGKLDFVELGNKYGFAVEVYEVSTEDDYILKLLRIRGYRNPPLLLMHGICDSADTWIIRGNTSLAIVLAKKGYDVWVGNCRGNKYSRAHIRLDPNIDREFWDVTFNEFGYYDLPAIIDTVLEITGVDKLKAIGHSQGNIIFYVLCSTRPEYNDKIELLIALAPICFLQNIQPPLKTIIELLPALNKLVLFRELFNDKSVLLTTWRSICPKPIIGYAICVRSILFQITGYDASELEAEFVATVVGHFPTSSSVKNVNHFSQLVLRRKFARYDYGMESNFAIYNTSEPPEYDLSKVKMKIALLLGANDPLATLDDVAILRQRLPNVVRYMVLPRRKMNHNDFVWGRHMEKYLFPYILDLLNPIFQSS